MEKFCLKWNDFQVNASKSFGLLKQDQDFFDVTLISDDDKSVAAHKVVLAASSDVFKHILRKADHSKPMIYLSGINQRELTHIIDYIYEGEVNVYQNELDDFLDVAQRLKIQGLVGSGLEHEAETKKYNKEETISEEYSDGTIPNGNEDQFIQPLENNSRERKDKSVFNPVNTRTLSLTTFSNSSMYEEAKRAVDEIVMKIEDGWMCKACNKTVKQSSQIRKHAETHIEGLSFPCQLCGDSFRSRIQLSNHKGLHHRS